jgi:hypothetical protein
LPERVAESRIQFGAMSSHREGICAYELLKPANILGNQSRSAGGPLDLKVREQLGVLIRDADQVVAGFVLDGSSGLSPRVGLLADAEQLGHGFLRKPGSPSGIPYLLGTQQTKPCVPHRVESGTHRGR